jgi:cytochrome c-type biogenesis protein CcmF
VIRHVAPGDKVEIAGYVLDYEGLSPRKGPNYVEDVATFRVSGNGVTPYRLEPAKRVYTTRRMPTTEAAIDTHGFSQLYLSLGEAEQDGSITLRAWWKPLVTLIWLGGLIMVAGGVASLSDRRLRVGAPRPAKARLAPADA